MAPSSNGCHDATAQLSMYLIQINPRDLRNRAARPGVMIAGGHVRLLLAGLWPWEDGLRLCDFARAGW
jgi:hypothetical protein